MRIVTCNNALLHALQAWGHTVERIGREAFRAEALSGAQLWWHATDECAALLARLGAELTRATRSAWSVGDEILVIHGLGDNDAVIVTYRVTKLRPPTPANAPGPCQPGSKLALWHAFPRGY